MDASFCISTSCNNPPKVKRPADAVSFRNTSPLVNLVLSDSLKELMRDTEKEKMALFTTTVISSIAYH